MLNLRKVETHLLQSWRTYAACTKLPDDVRVVLVRDMAVLLTQGRGTDAERARLRWLCGRGMDCGDWERALSDMCECVEWLWGQKRPPQVDDGDLPAEWLAMGRVVDDIGGGMRATEASR